MKTFWYNKPLQINENVNYILDKKTLIQKIKKDLSRFKVDLNTQIVSKLQNEHIKFIQKYYFNDPEIKLFYSKDLLLDYLTNDFIILELRSDNILVGLIIAKKTQIYIKNNAINSVDINYLCLHPQVRNLNLSGYIINKITLAVLEKWKDVNSAFYTIGYAVHEKYYCKKNIYHIPINSEKLINSKFIKQNFQLKLNNQSVVIKKVIPSKELIQQVNLWNQANYLLSEPSEHKHYKNFIHLYDNRNYMCLYRLDNICNDVLIKTGYIYKTNFNDPYILDNFLKYIKENNIYDLVNTTIQFDSQNLLEGTGNLYYYTYNLSIPKINSENNSLVTI